MNCLCMSVGDIFHKRIKIAKNNFPVRIALGCLKWEAMAQRDRCGFTVTQQQFMLFFFYFGSQLRLPQDRNPQAFGKYSM